MSTERSGSTIGEAIARVAYSLLWYLATPAIAGYLLWRARRQPAYRHDWIARFVGRDGPRPARPCLWVHAVSVGETRAAAPLVEALLAAHPDHDVVVTHMTPTGRETAGELFGDRVRHAYLAYDYPHAVSAFLAHWRPRIGIVMETEIWPNLLAAAERRAIPTMLANARLSAKSLVGARRWPALMRPAARRFAAIAAQTDADARRFGILTETEGDADSRIVVAGNVKFDVAIDDAQRARAATFRARLGADARVLLFASTRAGEEDGIVDAWRRHGRRTTGDGTRIVLAIVPRHPQRFAAVGDAIAARGLAVQRRSDDAPLSTETDVWLGDSMGELVAYYLAADVAYVGGSIAPLGGQNLIEAAAAGCPVLIGRHTFNFAAASDEAVRTGAAVRVVDYDALVLAALELADDGPRRRRMRDAGIAFAAAHRGATARNVALAERLIDGAWGSASRISSP